MLYIYFYEDKNGGHAVIDKPFNGCDVAAEARGWLARYPFGRVEIRFA